MIKKLIYFFVLLFAVYPMGIASATDSTIDAITYTTPDYNKQTPLVVWLNDTVGYRFYRDSGSTTGMSYSKSTDSGTTWSAATSITGTTGLIMSVWYDRWTPGDTTGTLIHIAYGESTSDDFFYKSLDTANADTLSAATVVNNTLNHVSGNVGDETLSISKNTNEVLFYTWGTGTTDTTGYNFVMKCAGTCTTSSNWVATTTNPNYARINDIISLMPLGRDGSMMYLTHNLTNDDILSKVYYPANDSWDTDWTTIDSNAPDHTTYTWTMMPTVDQDTGDIYLAYGADVAAATADIRTAVYSNTTRTWTSKTDVVTDMNTITSLDVIYDQVSDTIYTTYLKGTAGSDTGVYWKNSTDSMTTWSSEVGPINSTTGNLMHVRGNIMTNGTVRRGYVTFLQNTGSDDGLFGTTMFNVTGTASTPSYVPPVPTSVSSTTGNFWVNHTWAPGSGNLTDSYNVTTNGTTTNGYTDTYSNLTTTPHGWINQTIYAWNNSNASVIYNSSEYQVGVYNYNSVFNSIYERDSGVTVGKNVKGNLQIWTETRNPGSGSTLYYQLRKNEVEVLDTWTQSTPDSAYVIRSFNYTGADLNSTDTISTYSHYSGGNAISYMRQLILYCSFSSKSLTALTMNTQVPNNLPVMTGNLITPTTAYTADTLNSSTHTASDADSDSVTFTYQWYEDSVLMSGKTSSTLDPVDTMKGKAYKVLVTPNDGYENGTATYSNEVMILNTAPTEPTLTSDLGMNLINHTPGITFTKGTDADGDSVTTYIYTDGSNPPTTQETTTAGTSATLGSTTTLIDGNTYYVRARSWDGSDWSTSYSLVDTFRMNSLPSVPVLYLPTNSSTVYANPFNLDWNVSTDAESDPVTYDVEFDNVSLATGLAGSITSTSTTNGLHNWTVKAYDGYEYSSWASLFYLTIQDYPGPITNVSCTSGANYSNCTWTDPTTSNFDRVYITNRTGVNNTWYGNITAGVQYSNFTGLDIGSYAFTSKTVSANNNMSSLETWMNFSITGTSNLVNFTFTNKAASEGAIYQSSQASVISVNVNDSDGNITAVSAQITFLGATFNYSMAHGSGDYWSYDFKTGVPGTYTVTGFYAIDNSSGTNSSSWDKTITVVPILAGGVVVGTTKPTITPYTVPKIGGKIYYEPEMVNLTKVNKDAHGDEITYGIFGLSICMILLGFKKETKQDTVNMGFILAAVSMYMLGWLS